MQKLSSKCTVISPAFPHSFVVFNFPSLVGDFDKIWREHCEDEQTLSEYALAMKNLADNHWTKNCEGEGRIEWCRRYTTLPHPTMVAPSTPSTHTLLSLHSLCCFFSLFLPLLQCLSRILFGWRHEKNVGKG